MSLFRGESEHWEIAGPLYACTFDQARAAWEGLSLDVRARDAVRLLFAVCFIRHGDTKLAVEAAGALLDTKASPFAPRVALQLARMVAELFDRGLDGAARTVLSLIARAARQYSTEALFLRMYACIWTDHALALTFSLPLYARSMLANDRDQGRAMWMHAFVLGLNGLWDHALMLAERGLALWESLLPCPFRLLWKHEGFAVRASIEYYAGKPEKALTTYAEMEAFIDASRAFPFNAIYASATEMRAALAAQDRQRFQHSVQALRNMLGDKYDLRFALRAHSLSAVLYALEGRREDCLRELGLADALSARTSSMLEHHYHQVQKSRVYLQEGLVAAAIESARGGIEGIEKTAPDGPHAVEGYFHLLRAVIVAHAIISPDHTSMGSLRAQLDRCLVRLSRLVRGSSDLERQLGAMRAIASSFRRDLDTAALRREVSRHAQALGEQATLELLRALEVPEARMREGERYEGALRSAAEGLQRLKQLSAYLGHLDASAREGGEEEKILEHARAFAAELLGATRAHLHSGRLDKTGYTELAEGMWQRPRVATELHDVVLASLGETHEIVLELEGRREALRFRRDLVEALVLWRQITLTKLAELGRAREQVRQQRNEAVARTTQMLAHDVRKPFSLLLVALDVIRTAESVEELKELVPVIHSEVRSALTSVNGLIVDVMEVGKEQPSNRSAVRVEWLLQQSLREVCCIYPDAAIDFAYDLRHRSPIQADPGKMQRVLSNIVANAFQAMNHRGKIWIRATEAESPEGARVTIVVGNTGAQISPEDLPRIFDAFFTRNKPTGTGLGLAIAHQIVTSHGGRIWCVPIPETGVEFHFTVPVAPSETCTTETPIELPKRSDEAARASLTFLARPSGDPLSQQRIDALERQLASLENAFSSSKLEVLILEDEELYGAALTRQLESTTGLSRMLQVTTLRAASGLAGYLDSTRPDLVIADIDLQDPTIDGLELVRRMRKQGLEALICMHSNRTLPSDFATAIAAGADMALPKPMSRAHFLGIVLEAARRRPPREVFSRPLPGHVTPPRA